MKRLFTILFAFVGVFAFSLLVVPNNVHAQIVKPQATVSTSNIAKSILSGVDTAYATFSVDSYVKSFKATVTDTSGTVGGKVYFQGSYGDGDWFTLDSLVVSATGKAHVSKVFYSSYGLVYGTYRCAFYTTGTHVSTVKASYLRRN
jgi:hypothetical protein